MKKMLESLVKNACYKNGWPISTVAGAIERKMTINIEYMMEMNAYKIPQDYYHKFVKECEGL